VYARTTRQLIPFLVLTAAYGLDNLYSWKPGGRWLVNALIAIIFVQAAWNYRLAYKIVYPREFIQEIQEQHPDFRISEKMMRFYAPLICKNSGFLAVNFHVFYNWPHPLPPIQGYILLSAPHPDNFLAYQYDGYSPEERQLIRQVNFKMEFYKLEVNPEIKIENCYQANR
jgi:hypothetical protein